MYGWALQMRGLIETTVNAHAQPTGPMLAPTSFTTNTIPTGTMTGTDITDCLCTLIQLLNNKGLVAPNVSVINS